jgi:hypothetical protein
MSDGPSHRRFENDEEREEPREQNRTSVVVWLVAIGAALLVLLVGVAGVGLFALRTKAVDAEQAARAVVERQKDAAELAAAERKQAEANPQPMSRDEFKTKVMGKSAEEVRTGIGEPDKTVDVGGRSDAKLWSYAARTFDPANGKADSNASLTFEDGAVTKVESVDGS